MIISCEDRLYLFTIRLELFRLDYRLGTMQMDGMDGFGSKMVQGAYEKS